MNIFLSLQSELKALLQAQSYFSDIPIVIEDKGDITDEIAQALAQGTVATTVTKTGLAIVILTPTATNNQPVRRDIGNIDIVIKVLIGVYENVPVNTDPTTGINKRSLDVIQNVMHYICMKQADRGFTNLKFDSMDSARAAETSIVNYNLFFDAQRVVSAAST